MGPVAPVPARAPVVAVLDTAGGDTAAVRGAAREAARRGVALRLLVPAEGRAATRRSALVRALAAARRAGPRVPVRTELGDRPVPQAARTASAGAALLVVAGTAPAVDDLVTAAHCPLVVVPPGTGGDGDGPVLLAAGPATPDPVVAFAFAAAEARGAELHAVRTWHHPLVELGLLTGDRIARWDAADAEVRRDLAEQIGLAALAHPGVPVRTRVVDDGCADLLTALARRARLLVLGRPARGAALGRLAPSPALVLARLAPCPVAVVPGTPTVRPTLLPERAVGLADLRG